MTPTAAARATIGDLLRVEGKAELIDGRIVKLMPGSRRHNMVAGRIYRKLADFVDASQFGEAYTDNMTFAVDLPATKRQSFAPDTAFYSGPLGTEDEEPGVIDDAPTFAVEVRSDDDYGPAAELRLTGKRAEYFACGTLVVWDVDPETKEIRSYRAAAPEHPVTFTRGQTADAEPAVPGWRIAVDTIFST